MHRLPRHPSTGHCYLGVRCVLRDTLLTEPLDGMTRLGTCPAGFSFANAVHACAVADNCTPWWAFVLTLSQLEMAPRSVQAGVFLVSVSTQ